MSYVVVSIGGRRRGHQRVRMFFRLATQLLDARSVGGQFDREIIAAAGRT